MYGGWCKTLTPPDRVTRSTQGSSTLATHDSSAALELRDRAEGGANVGHLVGGGYGNGIEGAVGVVMMDEAILEMHVLAARAVELLVRHLDAGMIIFVD